MPQPVENTSTMPNFFYYPTGMPLPGQTHVVSIFAPKTKHFYFTPCNLNAIQLSITAPSVFATTTIVIDSIVKDSISFTPVLVITKVCDEGVYEYGFNGKFKDNEWAGVGNHYDYGARMQDPRTGRFISVDPLTKQYPWYTPYQFAGNSPIRFIDRDGLEPARPDEKRAAWLRLVQAIIVKRNAEKAFEAAHNSNLPDPRDGKQDAFRHAYWNALNARDLGLKTSEFFPTLHETGAESNNPNSPQFDPVATKMDLHNNKVGREIGANNPGASDKDLAKKVTDALNKGELKTIKMGEDGNGDRVPVDANGNPVKDNKDKVLQDSAPKKDDSKTQNSNSNGSQSNEYYGNNR